MNNFEINPCKACFEKFRTGKCSINSINNCCYTTLAAYKGNPSINSFRNSPEGQNCAQCLTKAINMFGNSTCDLRLTASPVFDISNHYFPNLIVLSSAIKQWNLTQMALFPTQEGFQKSILGPLLTVFSLKKPLIGFNQQQQKKGLHFHWYNFLRNLEPLRIFWNKPNHRA